jgi:hypothetical protein
MNDVEWDNTRLEQGAEYFKSCIVAATGTAQGMTNTTQFTIRRR